MPTNQPPLIASEILAATVIVRHALEVLLRELSARRPACAEVLRADQALPPGQGRASLVGGVRRVERVVSFNAIEGRIETPVPSGQLPIVQLIVGRQPLSLGIIARTDADDAANPDDGAARAHEFRWVSIAAVEDGSALARHTPIPLTERIDPHVFPLIDSVLQLVDAGMHELAT